jgi:DNA modification methylase
LGGDIPYYIGIDSNTHLYAPYTRMVKELEKHSTTKSTLFFQDALSIDYNKLNYDMVFTSPPYYNIEIYRKGKENTFTSKDEWNIFYRELITRTFQHLRKKGMYCLNIPAYIYSDVVVPLLGECHEKYPLFLAKKKTGKVNTTKYSEFIYIWLK